MKKASVPCPLCLSNTFIHLFSFVNPRSIGAKRLYYEKCKFCTLTRIHPMLKVNELESLYSDVEYFEKLAKPIATPFLNAILSIRFFPEYDEYVEKHTSKGSLLDIGCGNGEFAEKMLLRGWSVQCIEKSIVAAKRAEKRIGIGKIKVGEVTEVDLKSSFDVITAWHVLEHVPNPSEFVHKIGLWLKPKGKFIFELPNADSINLWLFRQYYSWLMVPEHIFYYSPQSIAKLLDLAGLHVVEFSFPTRAILNFSLSVRKIVAQKIGTFVANILFIVSLPLSLLEALLASLTGRSEVVRVVASKN